MLKDLVFYVLVLTNILIFFRMTFQKQRFKKKHVLGFAAGYNLLCQLNKINDQEITNAQLKFQPQRRS
jgi:hypothetical protein